MECAKLWLCDRELGTEPCGTAKLTPDEKYEPSEGELENDPNK